MKFELLNLMMMTIQKKKFKKEIVKFKTNLQNKNRLKHKNQIIKIKIKNKI